MHRKLRRNLTIGTAFVAAAAFAGGAYAATQDSGATSRQAFLNDVAKRLNVTPAQLNAAIKGAQLDQLEAEVKAGRLTQAQANALKQRIEQGIGGPLWFGAGGFHRMLLPYGPGMIGGNLEAAASYLGLTNAQLLSNLSSGKSLAQIAKEQKKSVSGLEDAMLAAAKSKLANAVSSGRLTAAEEKQLLSDLQARIAAQVNQAGFPRPGCGWRMGGDDGRDGFRNMPVPRGAPGGPAFLPAPPPPGGANL